MALGASLSPLGGRSDGAGPDRLRGLLAAHRVIASDLNLPTMLERIVAAACDLVGARYGALGVVSSGDALEQFVHHGIDPGAAGRVRTLTQGRCLLTRLAFGSADGAADADAGANAEGPPEPIAGGRRFLAVPIQVGEQFFGDLYLADPLTRQFRSDDEDLLTALAAMAGTAIQNGRLYAVAHRSAGWLQASGEISRALLQNTDVDVLLEVVSRALDAGDADYGALMVPTDDGRLKVLATAGVGSEDFRGHVFDPAGSSLGRAIIAGENLLLADMSEWANDDFENRHSYGPAMIAPLADIVGLRGAMLLMRTSGRPPFETRDVELATTFAAQVALALHFDDTRADAEWLRVLEDRQRIAQDLHDNVIQRLFATGVGLQGLADLPLAPDVRVRLRRYIVDLDETIDEIRSRVFGLRGDAATAQHRRPSRFPRVEPTAAADLPSGLQAVQRAAGHNSEHDVVS